MPRAVAGIVVPTAVRWVTAPRLQSGCAGVLVRLGVGGLIPLAGVCNRSRCGAAGVGVSGTGGRSTSVSAGVPLCSMFTACSRYCSQVWQVFGMVRNARRQMSCMQCLHCSVIGVVVVHCRGGCAKATPSVVVGSVAKAANGAHSRRSVIAMQRPSVPSSSGGVASL